MWTVNLRVNPPHKPRSVLPTCPGGNRSQLLVDDVVILEDWDREWKEITRPGQVTLYCALGSVRVLVDGQVGA